MNKYTARSETLYFNQFYAMRFDNLVGYGSGQAVKHIYLGDTRIVTKLNTVRSGTWSEEVKKQYFYHSDHLGSASLISDCDGREYQRIEYTPYGETWVEKTQNTGMEYLPYKFTGKERDEETGLYYFGARYLDPQYSRWMSCDPALGDYIPVPNEDVSQLPAGGIFKLVNLCLYHYASNNPIRYIDPNGREAEEPIITVPSVNEKKTDSFYKTPFPEQNGTVVENNQTKTSKLVWAEGSSTSGGGEESFSASGGFLAVKSKTNTPLYVEVGADVLNANVEIGVSDDGIKYSTGVNVAGVNGKVGLQFETKDRKLDMSVGASASIGGNFAVKFEKQKGFVFDVKFLLGLRLEANWGKKNEK